MVQNRVIDETDRVRARRREILRAAGSAFRVNGFHGTSMRDVAASLGMAVGNLYYYFENKQALLAFCQDETGQRLLRMSEADALDPLSPHERLRWLIVGHIYCVNEAIPGATAHLSLESLSEFDRERCIGRRDEYERRVRGVVEEGIAKGSFRSVDPRVAVWTILGAMNSTVTWFRRGGPRSALDLGEAMADQLVSGLLAVGVHLDPNMNFQSVETELSDSLEEPQTTA